MEGQLSNDGRSRERQSGCSSSAEYSNQSCLILSGTHNSNPLFLGVAFYGRKQYSDLKLTAPGLKQVSLFLLPKMLSDFVPEMLPDMLPEMLSEMLPEMLPEFVQKI